MTDAGSITYWVQQLQAGQSAAATELWERYYDRLVGLARQKLRTSSKRVVDEDDVVIDVFDSLCRGVQAGRFPKLNDGDDLWQIMVMLTARKAVNQRKHHHRLKRGGGRLRGESVFQTPEGQTAGINEIVGKEPTPEFAEMVGEESRRLLEMLPDDTLRTIAIAKLHGYENAEIAQQLNVQTRTIERKLHLIRQIWSTAEGPQPDTVD
jgi:RNA polymerase sigma factor (sigma-70 family)